MSAEQPDRAPSDDTTPGPEQPDDVKSRVQRFAALRAAERALLPACLELQSDRNIEAARALRTQLQELVARGRQVTTDADPNWLAVLSKVDAALDEQAEQLCAHVDATPISQLRAALPEAVAAYPREVTCLLELLVGASGAEDSRLWCIEYLITLLCCEQRGGLACVARDPAQLTPTLARFCAQIEAELPAEIGEAEISFRRAAAALGQAPDPDAVREEARALKARLWIHRFAPKVLREIVSYNSQLRNLVQLRRAAIRRTDEDFHAQISEGPQAARCETEPGAEVEAREEPGSPGIFESDGLQQIRQALFRRLGGVAIGACTSESIALNLETSDLEAFESQALRSESPDELQILVANSVVVGMLVRILPTIEERLLELSITSEQLQDQWINELNESFQEVISARIGAGEYEEATSLSGIRTKYLYDPLSKQARARKADPGRPPRPAGAVAAPAHRRLREADQFAQQAMISTGHPDFESRQGLWTRFLERPSRAIGGVVAASLAGFIAVNTIALDREIHDLDRRELANVSKYLTSAYRDGGGDGPLMIGRIRVDWHRLDALAQHEVASEIVDTLHASGVSRIIVYDDNYRPVIQFAGGKLRTPTEPAPGY